jgi:hypothetical protein
MELACRGDEGIARRWHAQQTIAPAFSSLGVDGIVKFQV